MGGGRARFEGVQGCRGGANALRMLPSSQLSQVAYKMG